MKSGFVEQGPKFVQMPVFDKKSFEETSFPELKKPSITAKVCVTKSQKQLVPTRHVAFQEMHLDKDFRVATAISINRTACKL
jgi:hypothetical protein